MKNLCIIPACGGSKRIPRKNVKPFMGKPILAYSIDSIIVLARLLPNSKKRLAA